MRHKIYAVSHPNKKVESYFHVLLSPIHMAIIFNMKDPFAVGTKMARSESLIINLETDRVIDHMMYQNAIDKTKITEIVRMLENGEVKEVEYVNTEIDNIANAMCNNLDKYDLNNKLENEQIKCGAKPRLHKLDKSQWIDKARSFFSN